MSGDVSYAWGKVVAHVQLPADEYTRKHVDEKIQITSSKEIVYQCRLGRKPRKIGTRVRLMFID